MVARCFTNQLSEQHAPAPLEQALPDLLSTLLTKAQTLEGLEGGGVYVGVCGIALTLWHVASALAASGPASALGHALQAAGWDGAALVAHATRLCTACVHNEGLRPHRKRVTFLEGQSGPLALLAVLQHHAAATGPQEQQPGAPGGGDEAWRSTLQQLLALDQAAVQRLPPGECEVLYGRAGYLWALLFARQHLPPGSVPQGLVKALVQALLDEGAEGAARHNCSGLMYQWHDSLYLGAAHGLCGVLHVLLLTLDVVDACDGRGVPPRQRVLQGVQALLGACYPSGNLPSSVGSTSDRLVQWCHGAPGLLLLMPLAMAAFPEHQVHWLPATRKAAQVVWERGLLCKGLGLCHGTSGNAYALLAAGRAMARCGAEDEARQQLRRARLMESFGVQHLQQLYDVPDRPASLYEGLAGQACLLADLCRPEDTVLAQALQPGYELPLPCWAQRAPAGSSPGSPA